MRQFYHRKFIGTLGISWATAHLLLSMAGAQEKAREVTLGQPGEQVHVSVDPDSKKVRAEILEQPVPGGESREARASKTRVRQIPKSIQVTLHRMKTPDVSLELVPTELERGFPRYEGKLSPAQDAPYAVSVRFRWGDKKVQFLNQKLSN